MKNLFRSTMMVAAAITLVGFTGCQKDNGSDNPAVEVKEATLSIKLANPTLNRATGAIPTTDNTVQNFSVFVLDADGNAVWKAYVDNATTVNEDAAGTAFDIDNIATTPYIMKVTTAAKNVYVIANAGDQTGTYSSLTALQDAKIDLSTQKSVRWATGSTTSDITFAPVNSVQTANVDVVLQFVAARITLNVVNNMTGYDGSTTPGTLIISDVAVLNARAQSKLFPASGQTSLIPVYDASKTYYEGLANPTPQHFANYPATNTLAMDTENFSDTYAWQIDGSYTPNYYYVFENDALTIAAFPTIITLVGTASNGTDKTYFPVHLAPYETLAAGSTATPFATGIVRGNSYDITITLTGDATIDGGGGTTDPTVNVVNALVNITLEVTDWNPITINKEF